MASARNCKPAYTQPAKDPDLDDQAVKHVKHVKHVKALTDCCDTFAVSETGQQAHRYLTSKRRGAAANTEADVGHEGHHGTPLRVTLPVSNRVTEGATH